MKIVTVATPGSWRRESRVSVWRHWHRPNLIQYHPIDPEDQKAYEKILTYYWELGEDFAIVEPDIVIREDVAEAFLNCECVYGGFVYPWLTDIGIALGCTWFRSEFLQKFPTAMKEVAAKNVSWRQLDVVLMRHILARKYMQQPHIHLPPVAHLNPEKQLLPEASTEPLMYVPEW